MLEKKKYTIGVSVNPIVEVEVEAVSKTEAANKGIAEVTEMLARQQLVSISTSVEWIEEQG